MNYYHYTKGGHLLSILDSGVIKTAIMGFGKTEKNAVNLTTSEDVEATAYLGAPIENQGGAFRFIINPDFKEIITWAKYKHVGRIHQLVYDGLNTVAKSHGSDVSKWYVTLSPIPKKYWLGFELLDENGWFKPYEEWEWTEYMNNGTIPALLEKVWGHWRNIKPTMAGTQEELNNAYNFIKNFK